MFCSQCGTTLKTTDKFCQSCGTATPIAPSAPLPSTPTPTFFVPLLVIPATKKEGLLKSIPVYLIFYTNMVIVSHLNKDRQNQAITEYHAQIKAQDGGFFAKTVAMADFWNRYGDRYMGMPYNSILNEDSDNFTIAYTSIAKFRFIQAICEGYQGARNNKLGTLTISANSVKYKYSHNLDQSNPQVKKILSSLFGNRLKYH